MAEWHSLYARLSLAPCLKISTDKRMNSVVNASTGLRHTWILHFYDSISLKAPASSSHSAIPGASWLQRAASDFPENVIVKMMKRVKKSLYHRSTSITLVRLIGYCCSELFILNYKVIIFSEIYRRVMPCIIYRLFIFNFCLFL